MATYNEGNPEIFVDQGLYYPPSNYAYYCTGFESPVEWEDHQRILGAYGPETQYAGAQTESSPPYVYYTPSYGYAQSPYNPYNPYIPGAVVGIEGSYVGAQQYYSIPPYHDPVSSPGYIPIFVQPDITTNSSAETLFDNGVTFADRPDGRSLKHGLASSSAAFSRNLAKPALNQTNSLTKTAEGTRANVGPSKHSVTSLPVPTSSHMLQNRSASEFIQPIDNISSGKFLPQPNQLKVAPPMSNGFSDVGSSAYGQTAVDKLRSKIHNDRNSNDMHVNPDVFDEQNRGPRTNKLKNQIAVKAYTTKVGNSNAQGNIIIYTDQYNKDDISVNYANAKFFVIKSYSEDDVHKSIKYNVWSSTPHGNKKLQIAYEDAQKISIAKPGGCPIFLFFSVNASGQFCGVAEMIGPVDFHKDMDFWQQDKWSGSFPVKWHIIKDVPNTSFRHIILENNEFKPVTNSRDTQEIMFKEGLEMLKIFKNYLFKTSLLDDFMYYENRQKIMHKEKAMLRSFESPFTVSSFNTTHKLNHLIDLAPDKDDKILGQNGRSSLKKTETSPMEEGSSYSDLTNIKNGVDEQTTVGGVDDDDATSALRIGSLSIKAKHPESKTMPVTVLNAVASIANTDTVDVVTVGSMPVKVNGFAESSSFLTVGTIPLDPRALQLEEGAAPLRRGSQH